MNKTNRTKRNKEETVKHIQEEKKSPYNVPIHYGCEKENCDDPLTIHNVYHYYVSAVCSSCGIVPPCEEMIKWKTHRFCFPCADKAMRLLLKENASDQTKTTELNKSAKLDNNDNI